jgi:hypothetical protein
MLKDDDSGPKKINFSSKFGDIYKRTYEILIFRNAFVFGIGSVPVQI